MYEQISGLLFLIYSFLYSDIFVPVWHSMQEIATRANTNPETK